MPNIEPRTDEPADRNVFILGAGFSAPAGAPLIRDFLDVAREIYDDPSSPMDALERAEFTKVFEFRRKVAEARDKIQVDLDNIEKLFGLVEMSHRLSLEQPETRNAMVYLIAKTLQVAIEKHGRRRHISFVSRHGIPGPALDEIFSGPDPGRGEIVCDIYDYFAAMLAGWLDHPDRSKHRKNTVITFNYDLLLDDALRRVHAEPNYHMEFTEPADDRHPQPQTQVSVLKLHGSTNWAICTGCRSSTKELSRKVTSNPVLLRGLWCPKCKSANSFQPLLIPPSWDKSEYRDIVGPVWMQAAKELFSATRICIIGYSMPQADAFFESLLTLGLSRNHGLYRLIAISKGEELKTRLAAMLDGLFADRRFIYEGDGLEMFLVHGAAKNELGRWDYIETRGLY